MMSYDIKYRKRTIEYREEGHTIEQTCQVFKISPTTLKRWVKKYRETGDLKDSLPAKRKPRKIDPEKLKTYLAAHPDAYQHEMAKAFDCSRKAIWQALRKHGITLKKR
jgi:transposase